MSEEENLTSARRDAQAARERLVDDAHALQARLKPAVLAENAWDGVRARGQDVAERAVGLLRRRPVAASAAAAGIVALIARRPIAALFTRLTGTKSDTPAVRRPRGERK